MSRFSNARPFPAVLLVVVLGSATVATVGWLVHGMSGASATAGVSAVSPHGERGATTGAGGMGRVSADQMAAVTAAVEHTLAAPRDPRMIDVEAVLAVNPDDVEGLLTLGYLHVEARRYSQAREAYLRASQLAPANLEARTHLGTTAYFLGDVGEAMHHYQQVLAVDPDLAMALFEMGAVQRYGQEDLAGAVATWRHFLAVDPDAMEADRIRELVMETETLIESTESTGETDPPAWPGDALGDA